MGHKPYLGFPVVLAGEKLLRLLANFDPLLLVLGTLPGKSK